MFGLFKKNSKPEIKRGTEAPVSPFEILLPEELTQAQIPNLHIGSKVLDILRTNSNDVQTLEVFEGMPVVNSNNAQLKEFVNVVNGAKQTSALKEQIGLMCFAPKTPDSLGALCCLVNGVLHEFHIINRGGGATLNYQFTRVVHAKAQ
ncbi:hypothetical protein [Thalassotalea litorea]|uniref:hypothetical protein n=1 Tax=Thalassotalea litorea TaxID=2020715 RepID=UPI003736A33A